MDGPTLIIEKLRFQKGEEKKISKIQTKDSFPLNVL